MPKQFTFFEDQFTALVNNPGGGVANELRRVANEVVQETKEHLSVPAPKDRQINTTGVPWLRTGDLQRSVRAVQVFDIETRSIEMDIVAGSVHDGVQYAAILMERDFDLVPPRVRALSNQ